jgi:hypothetical protein
MKRPHTLLLADSRAARVKITINGIPNTENNCAIYVIYKRDRGPHNISWQAALETADLDFRPMIYGSCWSGKLQLNRQSKSTGKSCYVDKLQNNTSSWWHIAILTCVYFRLGRYKILSQYHKVTAISISFYWTFTNFNTQITSENSVVSKIRSFIETLSCPSSKRKGMQWMQRYSSTHSEPRPRCKTGSLLPQGKNHRYNIDYVSERAPELVWMIRRGDNYLVSARMWTPDSPAHRQDTIRTMHTGHCMLEMLQIVLLTSVDGDKKVAA